MNTSFNIVPIGYVLKKNESTRIEIDHEYTEALEGLNGFSHIIVLYWFDKNDTQGKRNIRKVHPRKNPSNPLTGVFATHSPVRPNLIALSYCKNLGVEKNIIHIDEIDAYDNTPVIDIKAYIPMDKLIKEDVTVPDWV